MFSTRQCLFAGRISVMWLALATAGVHAVEELYSPFVEASASKRVLFGDTHLHSSWSTDAGLGGATLGPEQAYKAAKGDVVVSHTGIPFRLETPLDFVVVADHAENLGLADFIRRSDPVLLANPQGKKWHDMVKAGDGYTAFIEWLRADNNDLINDEAMSRKAWDFITDTADRYYQPGVFSTIIGFEWTSHPGGNNMHRVVVFRDDSDKARQVLPYSQYDSIDPEDLWRYLGDYERSTGGRVLAIPHNGNLSNGYMFATETLSDARPFDVEYARTRAYFEPIVEVTQMKGTSETHPFLSPDDEFADHEIMDVSNLSGKAPKTNDMLVAEYARSALLTGLQEKLRLGVNPFKFGMIGATDAHTGLPSAREDNNFGKAHIVEPSPTRLSQPLIKASNPELSLLVKDLGASGLAGVWAEENTREAIWDALERREVFATTGPRISVRLFGGWGFSEEDLQHPLWHHIGEREGVPMGSDLPQQPSASVTPSFMVVASRDAAGANLDRIQIIKGWIDELGQRHERIFDVAVSGDRVIGPDGRCHSPVGSTVDLSVPTFSNSIGEAQLSAVWHDPEFDPTLNAFYYARVIEIPKPRWSAYDVARLGAALPENTAVTVQDRAYTSPIWYNP